MGSSRNLGDSGNAVPASASRGSLQAPVRLPFPLIILLYHHVAHPPPGTKAPHLYVTPQQFERHLRLLKRLDLQPVVFRDIADANECGLGPSGPRVMITFDDAFLDVYENGLPLLLQHGTPAVVYPVASEIGRRKVEWQESVDAGPFDFADADHLQEMSEAGCEIGSHLMEHRRLTGMPAPERRRSLATSRRRLEDLTGKPVLSVAYPYGDHDGATPDLAREAGYAFGVTVESGVNAGSVNPYLLRRYGAKGTRVHHPMKFACAMRRRLKEAVAP